MNAEKVLGIAVCAFACATGSAFANTTNSWFGVKPSGTDIGLSSVATNGVAVTVDNSIIQLDNDFGSALTFTPSNETPLSDGLVTITSSAVLTPSDYSDLAPVPGAQAGFVVAVSGSDTNFYGYASAGVSDAPAWIKLTGTPGNPEDATTFTIALNYRDSTVSFYQGDNLLADFNDTTVSAFSISNDFTRLTNLASYGSGSISSVTSQYEVAVAAVVDGATTNLYGSASEAVVATRDGGSVKDITSDGNATDDKQATNGLYAGECDVLGIEEDATIPLQPATKGVAANRIAVAVSGYTPVEGVSVKFNVKQNESVVEGSPYDADAIGIPTATGTYTIEPVITAAP